MIQSIEIVTEVTSQFVSEFNALLPELSASAQPVTEFELKNIVTSPCTTLLVAKDEVGAVVGSLTLVVFRIPTGQRVWIEDVVVSSKCRGLGIGEALCNAAIKRAVALGAVSVDLTSRPSRTAANRLYQKLGFTQRETNVYRLSNITAG
ncbi:MAG: GNAT family N-acetyltransferase [Halothiobacillus sp.]|nr:GNAT family N-acetyltransferase [Halothiobacillus sp.]